MKTIVGKQEPKRNPLQNQENKKGKKAANEEKYITQRSKFEIRYTKQE